MKIFENYIIKLCYPNGENFIKKFEESNFIIEFDSIRNLLLNYSNIFIEPILFNDKLFLNVRVVPKIKIEYIDIKFTINEEFK